MDYVLHGLNAFYKLLNILMQIRKAVFNKNGQETTKYLYYSLQVI